MRATLTRAALVTVWLLGACSVPTGKRIELDIEPSPAARSMADTLEVLLARTGTNDTKRFTVALPSPPPTAPWILDLTTHGWGDDALQVVVNAQRGGVTVATGEAAVPAATFKLTVTLHDVGSVESDMPLLDLSAPDLAGADLAEIDLSVPQPDLAGADLSGADLAPSLVPDLLLPDLLPATLPDLWGGCANLATVEITPAADAALNEGSGNGRGSDGALPVSQNFQKTDAIFRFVTPNIDEERIRSVTLRLEYAGTADECGSGCGSCDYAEKAGLIDAYSMTSDWTEAGVNWTKRDGTTSWGTAGARGVADRAGLPFVTVTHAVSTGITLAMPTSKFNEFSTWRRSTDGSYSIMVGARASGSGSGAGFFTRSKEQDCAPTHPPATLILQYCP